MATKDQLYKALSQADAAGDTNAAQRFAARIKNGDYEQSQPEIEATPVEEPAEEPRSSSLGGSFDFGGDLSEEELPIAKPKDPNELQEIGHAPEFNELSMAAFKTGLGFMTTGDTESLKGILKSQYGDRVEFKEVNGRPVASFPSGDYEINKEGLSPQDIVRGLFDAASFTPAGLATAPVKVGAKTIIPKVLVDSGKKRIATAAVTNGATQTVIDATEGELGGKGVNAGETLQAATIGGAFQGGSDLIGAGYRAIKGKVAPQAQALIDAGAENGVKVLTSDVLPPQTFVGKSLQQTAEKVPLIGTGEIRQVQEEARKSAIDNVLDQYSTPSYDEIISSLKKKKSKIKTQAGNVLNNTGKKVDEAGTLRTDDVAKAIDEAQEQFSSPTFLDTDSAAAELTSIKEIISGNNLKFSDLKQLRTGFREIVDKVDDAGRSSFPTRAKALMSKVYDSMSKTMDDAAKNSLTDAQYKSWKSANATYQSEIKNVKKSKLKNILDKGDVTPEKVKSMIFSKDKSDTELLYKSLTNSGRANVRSAIIDRVTTNLNSRANGITPNSFRTEMKKQGLQIDTFFKGAEKKQLKGLIKVLNATTRASDAAVTTPTGQTLWGGLFAGSAYANPVPTLTGAASISTIARSYENPAVRNVLLKLGSLPQGSTRFEQALDKLRVALTSNAQLAHSE